MIRPFMMRYNLGQVADAEAAMGDASMGSLNDKVAIVTGASTGIGRAISIAYAQEGAKVVLAARRREKLESLAAEVTAAGGTPLIVPTDVTSEEQVVALFAATVKAFGRIDIVVNNAGTAVSKPTEELTLAEWRTVVDCNLTGAFLCSREAFKVMKPQRSGRILNIGSISSKMPRPNAAPYTSTKYAIEGLTHSLAVDGRSFGITASVLHPGNVVSDIWGGRADYVREKEGMMAAEELARVAVLMVTLPPDVNLYQAVILPVSQPFLGRG
jgi:NAD(P)-dependent dehydrogenase (short-subunit alcohol dehydrogenase family)